MISRRGFLAALVAAVVPWRPPPADPVITWRAVEVNPITQNYLGAATAWTDEVCCVFHIPPPLVGVLESREVEDFRQRYAQVYTDTLTPSGMKIYAEMSAVRFDDERGHT